MYLATNIVFLITLYSFSYIYFKDKKAYFFSKISNLAK